MFLSVSVRLSASVERFAVSRMQVFFLQIVGNGKKKSNVNACCSGSPNPPTIALGSVNTIFFKSQLKSYLHEKVGRWGWESSRAFPRKDDDICDQPSTLNKQELPGDRVTKSPSARDSISGASTISQFCSREKPTGHASSVVAREASTSKMSPKNIQMLLLDTQLIASTVFPSRKQKRYRLV